MDKPHILKVFSWRHSLDATDLRKIRVLRRVHSTVGGPGIVDLHGPNARRRLVDQLHSKSRRHQTISLWRDTGWQRQRVRRKQPCPQCFCPGLQRRIVPKLLLVVAKTGSSEKWRRPELLQPHPQPPCGRVVLRVARVAQAKDREPNSSQECCWQRLAQQRSVVCFHVVRSCPVTCCGAYDDHQLEGRQCISRHIIHGAHMRVDCVAFGVAPKALGNVLRCASLRAVENRDVTPLGGGQRLRLSGDIPVPVPVPVPVAVAMGVTHAISLGVGVGAIVSKMAHRSFIGNDGHRVLTSASCACPWWWSLVSVALL